MDPAGFGEVLAAAIAAQERGEGAVIATIVADRTETGFPPGSRLFVGEQGEVLGQVGPPLDPFLRADALRILEGKRSCLRSYRLSGDGVERVGIQGGEVDVFFEVLSRPPRLVVVGAGHIAVPLARMAKQLEFEVIVLDDRPEYASQERFPDAAQILIGPYAETMRRLPVDSDTYVVLVTRGHVHDRACLELLLGSDAAYIGMIGSKRRVRTVMEGARARGHDLAALQRVYAPIGLDIAAETPAEIALAIMAEIVNVRRGGNAASLALGERLHV